MAQRNVDDGLGADLVARKLLTQKQLERVESRQKETGGLLLEVLIEMGFATDGVLRAFADSQGVRVFDLSTTEPDPSAATSIDARMAAKHLVIPVGFDGDRLLLAVADPGNTQALDDVAALTGLIVEPVLASRSSILRAIDHVFGTGPRTTVEAAVEEAGVAESEPEAAEPQAEIVAPEVRTPEPESVVIAEAEPEPPEEPAEPEAEVRRIGRRLGTDEDVYAIDLHELLEQTLERGASDLHLTSGVPPVVRLHGELVPMDEYPVFTPNDLQKLIYGMLQQKQREELENNLELDMSYSLPGKARFRVNVYIQRGAMGAAFRLIPFLIKTTEDLGLPKRIEEFARLPRGLIVLTGPTGSGKTTTLATLLDQVNRERACHIMTIEDPIEFLHAHKKAIVNQREIGTDTHSFAQALRHVLRQDPDVILVGEMRDLETVQMAVTAAETGHLVLATLHTQDAPQTVDRVIDVFPAHQQQQIRVQLSGALMGVVAQQLIQHRDGRGRVVATEVLVITPAVRNLIREAKTHQIYSVIQAGGQFGMQSMDASLADLVRAGKISMEAGRERCHNVEEFNRIVTGGQTAAATSASQTARTRVVG